MATNVRLPPFPDTLPAALYFRAEQVPANTIYPWHSHAWGEFVYSFSGVMEVKLADSHYLAPPQYGVWLPPRVEHIGQNRFAAEHSSLYIAEALCGALPRATCAMAVSPLVRAMLDERLLQVLVDQLAGATCVGSYLPSSDDPQLAAVLRALEADPADDRPLADLAQLANTTGRTLMRRARRDLGMTLAEWRQRLRVVRGMAMLEQGCTVETIALDLGYASASAFIAMFRRLTNETPDEYRRRAGGDKRSRPHATA
jgi:AraC-like DNA-binding protein